MEDAFKLIGKGADPEFWSKTIHQKECYKRFIDDITKVWNDNKANGKMDNETDLKYSVYKLFATTGDRATHGNWYFGRRTRIAAAATMALMYPENDEYLETLMDLLFALCNEYSWCIAAHQPNLLTVSDRTFIDLFAAETGFMLAEIYVMLGDRLDPLIRNRIKAEIKTRIIDSYLSGRKFWWSTAKSNWAAVCSGSVGCTFMLMFPELFEQAEPKIADTMKYFLAGYGDDGYCMEGTHYWYYGFGFFVLYADMVKTFTHGEIDYFKDPHVKKISTFIQKMYISGGASVSFSDGGERATKYPLGLLHYLKKVYPDDIKVYSPKYSALGIGYNRYPYLLRSCTWLDEDIYNNPEPDNSEGSYYEDCSQWLVVRKKKYGFAAKGGHNAEQHNQNDVGTFIFAKDGAQILVDFGSGAYTKQYFRNETRYQIIECSSLGHNVPYFDDVVQKAGEEYRAVGTKFDGKTFVTDIAKTYGDENVKKVLRKFTFDDDKVVLKDEFDYTGENKITERFNTFIKPEVNGGTVKIGLLTMKFDLSEGEIRIKENTNSRGANYFICDFELKDDVKEFTLILE